MMTGAGDLEGICQGPEWTGARVCGNGLPDMTLYPLPPPIVLFFLVLFSVIHVTFIPLLL